MLEVLAETAVVAPAHRGKLLRAAQDDYSPQFPLRLMQKDFGLILRLADERQVLMPATLAAKLVNLLCNEFGDLDFSFVMEQVRQCLCHFDQQQPVGCKRSRVTPRP